MKNVVATIQARMGSTRLPGKVLKEASGKPILLWQVERIRRSRLVDNVIVATSTSTADDQIENLCSADGIDCFRGSETDVLNRIASLIRERSIDIHVECFGDSPLIDPQIIDEFVGFFLKHENQFDFLSNTLETTYPPGSEVIVYAGEALLTVERMLANDDPLREHAGYNITRFPEEFRIESLTAPLWYYAPEIYLEVDTTEDLEVMRSIIAHFSENGREHFTLSQILDFMRGRPDLTGANANVKRRWKDLRNQ